MTNSQINMLKESSTSQFQTIASSLTRDISVIWGRHAEVSGEVFYEAVDSLIRGYARYYNRHNIYIDITNLHLTRLEYDEIETEISVINIDQNRFIYIRGPLPTPFSHFIVNYKLDITENISNMQNIQNTLLIAAIAFSILAAFALYFLVTSIFKPLLIVADASKKIADGEYGERIDINGKNELARVAVDFNRMAQTIEDQIANLEEEALSKQQFADNFAHEIRTPLTSIYGYAQYMQKAHLAEEELIESTEYIKSEASHMNKIANSLLELATLRDYTPIINPINLPELFTDVAQSLETIINKQKAELTHHCDTDTLFGQEDLIKSLLLNLCTNAINSCDIGHGKVHIEAQKHDNHITLSVTDNGSGIPKDDITRICDAFYRVDKSRSREYGGTGLGLALCQRIVEAHNTKMSIKSGIGIGTCIKIKFTTP